MKRPRLRKWAKWACTAATVAMTVATIAGVWWRLTVCLPMRSRPLLGVTCGGGTVLAVRYWPGGTIQPSARLLRNEGWDWGVRPDGFPWRLGLLYSPGKDSELVIGASMLYPTGASWLSASALWILSVRGAKRTKGGGCRVCGYDLRGLAPDAKCPECGTVPAK